MMNHKTNNKTNFKTKTTGVLAATALAALTGTASAAVAQRDTREDTGRQRDKNNMRNLGTALGAGAVIEAIRGKTTNAIILGAGAAYSAKKYEDQRKAQAHERERRLGRNDEHERGLPAYDEAYQPIRVLVNDERVRFAG
jgi:hypothetical protein